MKLYQKSPILTSKLNFLRHVSNNPRNIKNICNTNQKILATVNRKNAIDGIPDSIKIKKKMVREMLSTKVDSIGADQETSKQLNADIISAFELKLPIGSDKSFNAKYNKWLTKSYDKKQIDLINAEIPAMITAIQKFSKSFDEEMNEIAAVNFMLKLSIESAGVSLDKISTITEKKAQDTLNMINEVESHLTELNQKLKKSQKNLLAYNKQRVQWINFIMAPLDSVKPSKTVEAESSSGNKAQTTKSMSQSKSSKSSHKRK